MNQMQGKKATLLLADGQEFTGYSMGTEGTVIGEVVFNTGTAGYQETLTDPSYYGQMIVQTFPLMGNYGANDSDFESSQCFLNGYIVREWCETPSNFRMQYTLNDFLIQQNVVGIYGIDTRRLTRIIREHGVMNGMITTEEITDREAVLKTIREYQITDAVSAVLKPQTVSFKEQSEEGKFHVAMLDFGALRSISKEFLRLGCDVTVLPCNTTAEELKALQPDGIVLSGGPGDPAENTEIIENLREIVKLGIPIFGISLGHQLLALAMGAKTEKLKYGHRGTNQPVLDVNRKRTFVTGQNHGYTVVNDSLDAAVGEVSHKNASDGTCEGIRYHAIPALSIQFYPGACGGPTDTAYLFDEFFTLMDQEGK